MNNLFTLSKRVIKNEYFLLSLILIFAFVVRLYKFNNPIADWHSWRQADTASVTRIFKDEGLNLLYPKYYDVSSIQSGKFNPEGYRFVEFPIYNAVSLIFYKIIPFVSIEAAGRLVTILFSLLGSLFLYLLGKRYLGVWGGLLSAFYYSFIPYNIYYSRVILPDPTATSLTIISLWFLVVYSDSKKFKHLLLSAIVFSGAILIKPFVIFYAVTFTCLLFWNKKFIDIYRKKVLLKSYLTFGLIIIVPFILWRVWINRYPEGIPFYSWVFNGNGIRFKPSYWYWLFGNRLGYLILGGWGLIPLSFGIVKRIGEKYFNQFFLLSAFIYFIVVANANVLHDYYQIVVMPAIAFGLAQGTLILWNLKEVNKYLSRFLLMLSLTVMFITGAFQIKDYYNVNRWEIVEAGTEVDKITPKDALVIAPYNGDTAFLYQTKRRGWPYRDRTLEELINRGADYFVSVDLNDEQTLEAEEQYKTIERTNRFIIIDLHQKNN